MTTGILDKTLGEIIKNNSQAQTIVMKSMKINAEQLQQMLRTTKDNQLMNMTVRDMFKNGVILQAISSTRSLKSSEQTQPSGQTPNQTAPQQKQSMLQKLKGLFR